MAANQESRSKSLEFVKKVSIFALGAELAFAGVAAFVAPELVVPALLLAAGNVVEIVLIDKFNKKKSGEGRLAVRTA